MGGVVNGNEPAKRTLVCPPKLGQYPNRRVVPRMFWRKYCGADTSYGGSVPRVTDLSVTPRNTMAEGATASEAP